MSESSQEIDRLTLLASMINTRGLNAPVILVLVAIRPFRYMLNQLLVITAPYLGWGNGLGTSRYSWFLEDQEQYDQLISMLDKPTRGTHGEEHR